MDAKPGHDQSRAPRPRLTGKDIAGWVFVAVAAAALAPLVFADQISEHFRHHEAICTIRSVEWQQGRPTTRVLVVKTDHCGDLRDRSSAMSAAKPYGAAVGKACRFIIGDFTAPGAKPVIVEFKGC